MGVGSPEITKLWREMTGGGRSRPLWPRLVRPGDVVPERKPLAATAPVSPREAVLLPESRRCAAGRLRSFALPQLRTNVESVRTVFCDAGTGPAVVFLQGPGANLTHWAWVAPRLVDRHRVLALDLPGTGESGADGARPSVKRWAAHVGRLLDARGVDRAAVVGHGLGAGVALELALRQPSRVTALALLDPAGLAPPPLWSRAAGHLLLRTGIFGAVLPRVWRRALDALFVEPNEYTSAFVHELADRCSDADVRSLAVGLSDARSDLLDRDAARTFEYVAAPTVLAWGGSDPLVDRAALRALAAARPGVEVREICGCGMLPMIERPAEVVTLLREFLPVEEPCSDASVPPTGARPSAAPRPVGSAADVEGADARLPAETDRSAPIAPEATAFPRPAAPEAPSSPRAASCRARRLPRALL